MQKLIIKLIDIYTYLISPFLGQNCRFYPSCSSYAKQAITEKGVIKGVGLTVIRLFKCHPFHPGGYDPVDRCQCNG